MKEKLLRLLRTPKGRAIAPVFLIVSLVGGAYGVKKSYVPPPLSAAKPNGTALGGYDSHAMFEKECKHCHAPIRCLSPNLCQDCHMDISRQRLDATGLHGLLPGTARCENCHTEHQGRDAIISAIPFVNVDHEQLTGFGLALHQYDYDGAPMACHQCHKNGRFAPESVDCTGCHSESNPHYIGTHTQRFGGNCVGCHDGRDRMIGFDHDRLFVLEGGHQIDRCEDCHPDQTFVAMSPVCGNCHTEPEVHAGEFGTDCVRCHGVVAWAPAQLKEHSFVLNHGSEEKLACQTCHAETYAAYTCYECHDHTPAGMQTVHAQEGVHEFALCADCHPTGQEGEAAQRLHDPPTQGDREAHQGGSSDTDETASQR